MRVSAAESLLTSLVLLSSLELLSFNIGDNCLHLQDGSFGVVTAIAHDGNQEKITFLPDDTKAEVVASADEFVTTARFTRMTITLAELCIETCGINVALAHELHRIYAAKNLSKSHASSAKAQLIIDPAFTLVSGDKRRMITYLPEQHRHNSAESNKFAKIIGRLLLSSRQKIFIESNDEGHGLRGQALKRIVLDNRVKFGDEGIIGNLPMEANLEPLEAGDLPAVLSDYMDTKREQDKWYQLGIPSSWLSDKIKQLENAAVKSRDGVQGRVLDEEAPLGHSWAVGGSYHASGVKAYLLGAGWTEVVLY